MRVLVTGVKGQLGYDVVNELKNRNHEVKWILQIKAPFIVLSAR